MLVRRPRVEQAIGGATAIIALPDQLRVAAIGNQNGNQNGKTNIPWQHHICQLNEVYSDILYECSCGVWNGQTTHTSNVKTARLL